MPELSLDEDEEVALLDRPHHTEENAVQDSVKSGPEDDTGTQFYQSVLHLVEARDLKLPDDWDEDTELSPLLKIESEHFCPSGAMYLQPQAGAIWDQVNSLSFSFFLSLYVRVTYIYNGPNNPISPNNPSGE